MFSSLTATAAANAAGQWSPSIVPVALVVGGLVIAVGLTGWMIRRLRSAAH